VHAAQGAPRLHRAQPDLPAGLLAARGRQVHLWHRRPRALPRRHDRLHHRRRQVRGRGGCLVGARQRCMAAATAAAAATALVRVWATGWLLDLAAAVRPCLTSSPFPPPPLHPQDLRVQRPVLRDGQLQDGDAAHASERGRGSGTCVVLLTLLLCQPWLRAWLQGRPQSCATTQSSPPTLLRPPPRPPARPPRSTCRSSAAPASRRATASCPTGARMPRRSRRPAAAAAARRAALELAPTSTRQCGRAAPPGRGAPGPPICSFLRPN
jgi:hypothetical protein